MRSLTRRTFAKLSAAAAATAVGPILAGRRLAASVTPQDDSLQSEFLIDLTLEAQSPHEVGGAGGGRLVVPVAGGTFQGPRMKGTVITPSGDWILERPDGSRVLDVRLLLQTDDAQTIYVSWRGIAYPSPAADCSRASCPCSRLGRRGTLGSITSSRSECTAASRGRFRIASTRSCRAPRS